MEFDEYLKFEINDSGNFIRITPIHHFNYFSDLDRDKNWINTRIEVKAGSFIGSY